MLLILLLLAASADSLREGLLALQRNDLAAARTHLEAASKQNPKNGRIWLGLAQTYRKLGNGVAAQTSARRAAAVAGADPAVLHGLALYHAEARDYSSAARYEARFAEAPSDPKVFANVIDLAQKGLEAGDDAELRNLLGKAHDALGHPDKAVVELQRAVRLKPDHEPYYTDLAQMLMVHQNFEAAIVVLEAARKRFPRSAGLALSLGIAYYGQRRFAEAVDAFLLAIPLAPSDERPYAFLGRILEHGSARMEEIRRNFAAFAKAHPSSHLGWFLQAKAAPPERADEAEALLRKAIALNAGFWESRFELAGLLERKRDYAGAAREFEASAKLNPHSPAPHYRLARLYDRLGDSEKAARERDLHQKLTEAEKAAIAKHAAESKRMQLVIQ